MSTALVPVEKLSPTELYRPGALDVILSRIEEEARAAAAPLEISTEANRKALASLAFKIARSKTYIDDQGKSLTEEMRITVNAVNQERSKARERLDALKDEIRKPLTDWEQADKDRVAAHQEALTEIELAGVGSLQRWSSLSAEAMRDRLKEIETDPRSWEEFSQRAAGVKAVAKAQILEAIAKREAYDKEQAELKRLQAEEAERIVKAREEAAAKAATEAAERKAKEAAEAAQRAAEAQQDRLRREAEYAEKKRIAAEQEAKRQADVAEARRLADEQGARRRAEEAAAQAKRDQEAAVERERRYAAATKEAEEEATRKREANKRHVKKINREAAAALEQHCQLADGVAELIVDAIVKGLIPHVSIEY